MLKLHGGVEQEYHINSALVVTMSDQEVPVVIAQCIIISFLGQEGLKSATFSGN